MSLRRGVPREGHRKEGRVKCEEKNRAVPILHEVWGAPWLVSCVNYARQWEGGEGRDTIHSIAATGRKVQWVKSQSITKLACMRHT